VYPFCRKSSRPSYAVCHSDCADSLICLGFCRDADLRGFPAGVLLPTCNSATLDADSLTLWVVVLQLCSIVSIVKGHVRNYLDGMFELVLAYWDNMQLLG
jgi:hypothetical protein